MRIPRHVLLAAALSIVALSETKPAVSHAAAQSVATWFSEPLRAGGKPAIVRAVIPVIFSTTPSLP